MTLLQKYHQEVVPQLQKELQLTTPMAVPRITKVVVNIGLKEAKDDKKVLDSVAEQIMAITGQKPNIRRATKSIAGFKLGKNQPIGLAVTLRGARAFIFLEKLIAIVLPRVRDFSGISLTGFDGQGNYNLGIKEQIVFTEIDFAKIDKSRGLQITIVTNAKNDQKALVLLKALGFPFAKQ